MPRKPTEPQMATMRRIEAGYPPNATPVEMAEMQPEPVVRGCFQSSVRDGEVWCHRVVENGGQLGRTDMFRIAADGFGRQV